MRTLMTWMAALTLVACAESTATQRPSEPTTLQSAQATKSCPFGVPNADVVVADTPDGAVMTFTTTPDKVSDLRERVADAAAMHGPGEQVGKGHDNGKHGEGGNHGLKAMQFPPMRATMDAVDNGAKLTLAARVPEDVPALQARARERAKAMAESCDR